MAVSVDTAAPTRVRSRWSSARRRGRSNPALLAGATLLALLLLGSLLGALLLVDPNKQNLTATYLAPGAAGHPLGTDALGRDLLAWCLGGIRAGLFVSVASVALSAAIGVTIGVVAGYAGGWVDAVLMRLVDLQLAVPPLVLFVAASALLAPSMLALILLISIVAWVPYARIVRARVLSERERPYIAAARLAGASRVRLLVLHLVRSAASSILVFASLQVGYVLLWESSLSFLGLGLQPPHQSLGYMVSQGRSELATAPWIMYVPGLTIVLIIVASNLLGDGLRDLLQRDEPVESR
jgi:peptide/nickel transport system permease protein